MPSDQQRPNLVTTTVREVQGETRITFDGERYVRSTDDTAARLVKGGVLRKEDGLCLGLISHRQYPPVITIKDGHTV